MTWTALRALPDARPRDLAELIRPEFFVDLCLPPRDNVYLYGQHRAVTGCERPGNELSGEVAMSSPPDGARLSAS